MRACVQRVSEARVTVQDATVGQIGQGVVVLLGVAQGDEQRDAQWLAQKIAQLRIFDDEHGKMNRSLLDVGGAMLAISQFTLLGDCRRGRRPSFVSAADPDKAKALYDAFVTASDRQGVPTRTGRFGQMMRVSLVNEGPVTILLDSRTS